VSCKGETLAASGAVLENKFALCFNTLFSTYKNEFKNALTN
jgi:hypothetical protein